MPGWAAATERLEARYADGAARVPAASDRRERQLVRLANVAAAAGLGELMRGRRDAARKWLGRAADHYRESHAGAPPESWGRAIGAVKCRLIAGDAEGAAKDARWALSLGAAEASTAIGRYAAALARLTLTRDAEAGRDADALIAAGEGFPADVAEALRALSVGDRAAYAEALARVVASFETRTAFLEDMPVADTVLALEALAEARGIAARPRSHVLPATS